MASKDSTRRNPATAKDKVIVITGASSGFGRGAAVKLAGDGAAVVLAARRADLLDEVAQECEAQGGQALAVPTDVGHQADMEALAAAALQRFGRIDVWINDAGVGALGRFEQIPIADHVRVIQTDLLGTIYGSYLALRQFQQQRHGILINIASALGKIPAPYYASYTAAKYGIVGLDAALRQELLVNRVRDIHICTVMPMAMDTPFFEHAANYTGHEAAPVPPMYNADEVVDVITGLVTAPQDEVIVGTGGRLAVLAHAIAPILTEKLMAQQTHRAQMKRAPLAGTTRGAVARPSAGGREVHGQPPARKVKRRQATATTVAGKRRRAAKP